MIYHWQRSLLPKHNTTELMVGIFPLAPHHGLLQYIHHVPFNANGVKTGVLQSPTPWNNTILGVPIHRNTYTIFTSNFQNYADLSHVQLFTLSIQDQAPRLPCTSLAGSQLLAYPEV